MLNQNDSGIYSFRINKPPNLYTLRLYLLIILFGLTGACLFPFSLSLNLSGKMASKGPSNEIKASADAVVSQIAKENELIKLGQSLFKFDQPNIKADIKITKARLKSIEEQFKTSLNECSQVKEVLKQNLDNSRQSFKLKQNAYKLETISKLNLLSSQAELDDLNRDIAIHQQRCTQEKNRLIGERNVLKEELEKQMENNNLTQAILAPSNGYLHRVSVKTGQQITAGQTLALFTSEGTAGANLVIPLRDRPFVNIGDVYLITSDAYQILNNPPIRQCKINAISPDSFNSDQESDAIDVDSVYYAQCEFEDSPLTGMYPFLVGMRVNGSTKSVKATLVQILLDGYRRLIVEQQVEGNKI